MENERALWAMQRVRQGDKTRRVATFRERIDYVLSRIAGAAARAKTEMQVWRNWQLGERARPVGDAASSTRRQNKESRDLSRADRLCFEPYRGRGCP